MKNAALIAKILTALAALVGVAYIIATYGEQIVAWAKKLLAACPCKCDAEDCADCECELDCPAEEVVAEEEDAAEEEAVVEETAEEVVEEAAEEAPVAEETAPVAEEADFEV